MTLFESYENNSIHFFVARSHKFGRQSNFAYDDDDGDDYDSYDPGSYSSSYGGKNELVEYKYLFRTILTDNIFFKLETLMALAKMKMT